MSKTIIVASNNPVKKQAALLGFQQMFPEIEFALYSVSVESGVKDQPDSDEETLTGANNRSANAELTFPDAHYWVGIEGGVQFIQHELAAFAWVVIRAKNLIGKGRTGTFLLPEAVSKLILNGMELGEADDIVFNQNNSKQKDGAVGLLTENLVDRCHLYAHAVILALIPFKNPKLYY